MRHVAQTFDQSPARTFLGFLGDPPLVHSASRVVLEGTTPCENERNTGLRGNGLTYTIKRQSSPSVPRATESRNLSSLLSTPRYKWGGLFVPPPRVSTWVSGEDSADGVGSGGSPRFVPQLHRTSVHVGYRGPATEGRQVWI